MFLRGSSWQSSPVFCCRDCGTGVAAAHIRSLSPVAPPPPQRPGSPAVGNKRGCRVGDSGAAHTATYCLSIRKFSDRLETTDGDHMIAVCCIVLPPLRLYTSIIEDVSHFQSPVVLSRLSFSKHFSVRSVAPDTYVNRYYFASTSMGIAISVRSCRAISLRRSI